MSWFSLAQKIPLLHSRRANEGKRVITTGPTHRGAADHPVGFPRGCLDRIEGHAAYAKNRHLYPGWYRGGLGCLVILGPVHADRSRDAEYCEAVAEDNHYCPGEDQTRGP